MTTIDLAPYDLDERIVWAFRRGLGGRFDPKDLDKIASSLSTTAAKQAFVRGAGKGAYEGASTTLRDVVRDTAELLEGAMNYVLEAYTTVYDPKMLKEILYFYMAAPDTASQKAALIRFADAYKEHHPAGSQAIFAIARAIPVLEGLAKWLAVPGNLFKVVMALAHHLGDQLGDQWEAIRNLTGKPEQQGFAMGRVVGDTTMTVALFILGF